MTSPKKKVPSVPSRFNEGAQRRTREHRVISGRRYQARADYTANRLRLNQVNSQVQNEALVMLNHMDNWTPQQYAERRAHLEELDKERLERMDRRQELEDEYYHWDDTYWHGGGDNFHPPPPPPPPAPQVN